MSSAVGRVQAKHCSLTETGMITSRGKKQLYYLKHRVPYGVCGYWHCVDRYGPGLCPGIQGKEDTLHSTAVTRHGPHPPGPSSSQKGAVREQDL